MPWPTTGRRPCYMRPTYHVSSWLAVLPRTAYVSSYWAVRATLPTGDRDSRPAVTAVAATSGSRLPTPFARKSTVQLLGWKDVFCCYRDNRGTLHSYAQHSSLTLNIFYAYVYVTKCIVKQAYSFFLQEAETLRLWAGTPTSIFRTENTRFSTKLKVTHCPVGVINKPTTVELWISPVYRRLAVAKFSQSTM